MAKDKHAMLMGIVIAVVAIGGLMYVSNAGFLGATTQIIGDGITPPQAGQQVSVLAVKDANVRFTAKEKLTGLVPTVNVELIDANGARVVSETVISAQGGSLTTTGPTTFEGYVVFGNDNYQSSTDRGSEVYYRKLPAVWTQKSNIELGVYDTYNESTITWTGYDDETKETTLNVTVDSGQTVISTELKLTSASKAAIGNPDFANPIAVCFNATTYASYDEIRPASYKEKIDVPGFLSGRNIVGRCYVLDTPALMNFAEYTFSIVIDPQTSFNPGDTESIYAFFLDKTYVKDDDQNWVGAWADDSDLTADTDAGIQAFGNEKLIALN